MGARNLFEKMPERNMVMWNTIFGGLEDSGESVEVFRLFLDMWEEFSDGSQSWIFDAMSGRWLGWDSFLHGDSSIHLV